MSRIGKIPVNVPAGVKVDFSGELLTVEGPKGKLLQKYHREIAFEREGDVILVKRENDKKQTRAYHGLYRKLLYNMVTGVSTGFSKILVITGVGFRAEVQGNILVLSIGYSNDFYVGIPEGISINVEPGNRIAISGFDKQKVGEISAQIRKLRPPEPYKGKGIRYDNEKIRRKVGKSGVK